MFAVATILLTAAFVILVFKIGESWAQRDEQESITLAERRFVAERHLRRTLRNASAEVDRRRRSI